MRNNKGVTLISLAITIIVLLILASITIGSIRDKKGIVKEAESSSAETEKESIIEKIEADLYNEKIKTGKKPTKSELKKIIEENGYSETLAEDSFTSKGGKYTINYDEILGWEDYILDGLILHLDAINNTGEGDKNHSNTVRTWKDLSKSNNDVTLANEHTFSNKELVCQKKEELISSISKNAVFNVEPEDYTIEIVAEYNTKEDWGWIFSLREDSNGKGLQFINYYNTDPTDHVTEYQCFGYYEPNGTGVNVKRIDYEDIVGAKFNRVVTYKKSSKQLIGYENSREIARVQTNPAILAGAKAQLGGTNWNKGLSLNGSIYSVRIYNRELTQEEIENNYRVDQARFGI